MWRPRRISNSCHIRMYVYSTSLVHISNPNKSRYLFGIEYLCWYRLSLLEENNIVEPELDMDPYLWIIWYIWKARNDKLFRGIDRNPLELVRYAKSECQAWFNANEMVPPIVQDHNSEEPQFLNLSNICMIDVDVDEYGWTAWKGLTYGGTKPLSTWITVAFRSRSTAIGDGEYASTFNMPELWDRL